MARAATTTDVFNAIAEPRRRQILELLARQGGLSVGALALTLTLAQPAVSKHLGVLRKVGVVTVVQHGKQRLYHLEAKQLKTVLDWVQEFEPIWTNQLERIKARAERHARDHSHTSEGETT